MIEIGHPRKRIRQGWTKNLGGFFMGLLEGKKGVVLGVANERSMAWAIAKLLHDEGMELAFTYVGGGGLAALLHSLAFAKKEELKGEYLNTSRDGFKLALDVSAYSLVALTRAAAPLMEGREGSIITLTYYGREKVIANYNVMGVAKAALETSVKYLAADLGPRGVRVNAISAGPIKTLAAMGITGFKTILDLVEQKAPLRRNVTQDDVARTALYLLSGLSSGVTGEIIHVDSGYNIMGM